LIIEHTITEMNVNNTMNGTIDHDAGSGKTETCPMCGQQFTCALSSTCWCASRKIPAAVSEYLAARFETCVCSACLDQLTEQFRSDTGSG